MKAHRILLASIGKYWIMSEVIIYWTLQSKCPQEWTYLFTESNAILSHYPLITLNVNEKISTINEQAGNYDALIISSQFAAEKISLILETGKHTFYTVGSKAGSLLRKLGHKVIHISENSKDLANHLRDKVDMKILHLSSEKSNFDIWPANVSALPFYGPKENLNFNLTANIFDSNSIIVFGSPSAVDVWFKKDINTSNATIATIGSTTANHFSDYVKQFIIVPEISTINHLCEAIHNHLKHLEYERTE